MSHVQRTEIDDHRIEQLLGLDSSKIGFYADVKQKIRELEAINLDLRTKSNELQAVFDSIQDGVAIFGADRKVQFRNHVCPRLFPGETLIGKACSTLLHPERPVDPESCPVEAALRGESRTASHTASEGPRTRYYEITATPIEDAFGRPSRALVFLRDVTERRLHELQLLQAEKMSSVGVLAAGVAHEINNPLTSVAGYAEGLLRRFRESESLDSVPALETFPAYLEVIVREAYRCKAIIDSLLSFSRRSDGCEGAVPIAGLVNEVLELVRHRAKYEQIEIREISHDGAPPVRGEAPALRQVILNLVMNALQAIDGPGRVTIETSFREGHVVLRVADTGCGIPRDQLDQIWDPFYTSKSVGQGLGLGLSVTYNIVRKHGGEIRVESEPGKGTTFRVFLPPSSG